MKAIRRPRSDSATSAVAATRKARAKLPSPPIELSSAALAFWGGIVRSRASDEWDAPTLFAAAVLSRVQAEIVAESERLDAEGSVLEGRANPRCKVVDDLCKRSMALMRTLRLGGQALGDIRDKTGARHLEREARRIAADLDDDELLAK